MEDGHPNRQHGFDLCADRGLRVVLVGESLTAVRLARSTGMMVFCMNSFGILRHAGGCFCG